LPMDFANMYTPAARRERAMMLLEQVGMADQAAKLPSAVSGGQQQRVAIARALANDPPIVMADEPTGNLDSKTAQAVFELFGSLVRQGKTIVMVTHDQDLAKRVSRAVIVADGQIVNEYVAKALATLSVEQLGAVTRQLTPQKYAPGATIVEQGDFADRFYIVTRGEVDVVLEHPDGSEITVNHLGEGSYFGEIGLVRGGRRTADVRASLHAPVEVVSLDRESFERLLAESEPTRIEIDRVIEQRNARTRAVETGTAV
jgi:putative ABC transport system ATP-binding protein